MCMHTFYMYIFYWFHWALVSCTLHYVFNVTLYCVDVVNAACVDNRQLRRTIEEALFIFPAVVNMFV